MIIIYAVMTLALIVLKYFDCFFTYKMVKKNPDIERMALGRWLISKIGPLKSVIMIFIIFLVCALLLSYQFFTGGSALQMLGVIVLFYLNVVHFLAVKINENVLKDKSEDNKKIFNILSFLIALPLMKRLKLAR